MALGLLTLFFNIYRSWQLPLPFQDQPGRAESALIDLGVPPGFSVRTEDLAARVARDRDVPEDYALPTIERCELTGRRVIVYVSNLSHENALTLSSAARWRC